MADIYNTEVVYKESKYYYWDVETREYCANITEAFWKETPELQYV